MSFPAKLEGGMCPADCGERIHTGDLIDRSEEHGRLFVHAGCVPVRSGFELAPGESVCGLCWLVRPCRCDE